MATKSKLDVLRSVPLLSTLSAERAATLAASISIRRIESRTVLFTEGDQPKNLFILSKGAAKLYSEHGERYATIAIVYPVRPLLLLSIRSERYPLSAQTLEPSELITVPVKPVIELLGRDAAFKAAVMREQTNESLEILEDFKNQRLRRTAGRVAHWILSLEEKTGTGEIVIPFDKRVLASYLGMAPEHLSRSFAALSTAGIVVNGRGIKVTDRAALVELAGLDLPDQA